MQTATSSAAEQLQQAISMHIDERTWRRVHHLEVVVDDEQIQVRGLATSYYVKQLAIQAVLDVIGIKPAHRIQIDIEAPTIASMHRRY